MESKGLPSDANPLEGIDKPAIRGRHLLIFLGICPAVLVLAIYLMREHVAQTGLLGALTLFFVVGLAGVAAAVAPLGWAALPALGFREVGWRPIVFGMIGTLVVSIVMSQIGPEPEGVKEALKVGRDPARLLASLAVIAALAPLAEELVFRGLLYGWLENRWNSGVAWTVSSLAFAAAHYEPAHILLVLPLGLMFGWLRRRTDSLVPSLFAHVANNAFAVIAAAYIDI
jgi:membrane protease YdiL (CAAX protease family)